MKHFSYIKERVHRKKLQEKINGTLMLYAGAPAILDLEYDKIRVSVEVTDSRWRKIRH